MAVFDTIYHTHGDPGPPLAAQHGRAGLSGAQLEVGWREGSWTPLQGRYHLTVASVSTPVCVLVNNGGADTLPLQPNACKWPVSGRYYWASLCGYPKDNSNPTSPTLNS